MITGDHPATAEAIAKHCNIIKDYHTKEEIAELGAANDPDGQVLLGWQSS
jgi:magnesium-transporting ATPase (P-type)